MSTLICFLLVFSAFSAEKVIYPQSTKRELDIEELLHIIIDASKKDFGACELVSHEEKVNEAKLRYLITHGSAYDVIWSSATPYLEKYLIPIWQPIRKGLLGYRIFIIRKQDQPKFSKLKTLNELKKLTVAQGRFWNDVEVFRANNINVQTSTDYESLFDMVSKGRVDYFSRGVNEAPEEYDDRIERLPNLHIEQDILVYYPWPKFFYVSKKKPQLEKRIKHGFELIKTNGQYDKWFWKHNEEAIKRAKLKSRKLFRLHNPLFTKESLLNDTSLWFNPFE
ncbi:transporter substrate-binding domain-containing protein [Spartinivicinus poritis]|uniref:Transporter substrate-binding domain-containing protein n=1 Tax=Spartinivicinus poritis TaxID=2994640 RepID=A0ABT5U9S8_9GAMM|nr:transporter substrate-binding domain-containing protein [Spartinivicinus sp. A2-2]MDE1463117.1 transporter substrate-binding domain-containing protein [Spartinivicinus sp. A2-2]